MPVNCDWICPSCGYDNHRRNLMADKVCVNCGWRDPADLPDDPDGVTPGYY